MSGKVKINLYIKEEIKRLASEKAAICKSSISNLFEKFIQSNEIINFNSINAEGILKVCSGLNEIEQHLYQIRKSIFEVIERGGDAADKLIEIKKFIDNWHVKINEQTTMISKFINELNKVKQGLKL